MQSGGVVSLEEPWSYGWEELPPVLCFISLGLTDKEEFGVRVWGERERMGP
jgi:hypothetical protein